MLGFKQPSVRLEWGVNALFSSLIVGVSLIVRAKKGLDMAIVNINKTLLYIPERPVFYEVNILS